MTSVFPVSFLFCSYILLCLLVTLYFLLTCVLFVLFPSYASLTPVWHQPRQHCLVPVSLHLHLVPSLVWFVFKRVVPPCFHPRVFCPCSPSSCFVLVLFIYLFLLFWYLPLPALFITFLILDLGYGFLFFTSLLLCVLLLGPLCVNRVMYMPTSITTNWFILNNTKEAHNF